MQANIINKFEVRHRCSTLQAENPVDEVVNRMFAASESPCNKKASNAFEPHLHVISSYIVQLQKPMRPPAVCTGTEEILPFMLFVAFAAQYDDNDMSF